MVPAVKPIEHGTHTGYRQHQRRGHRGIEICDDCREAWRVYNAEWIRKNYDPQKRRQAYLLRLERYGHP